MTRVALVLALAAAACRHAPSDDDCARLFDHFLEVEGAAATEGKFVEMTPPMQQALADGQARARRTMGGGFVALCTRELSQAELDCAMTATSEAGMDDCERP